MNWKIKAYLQRFFDAVPYGHKLNYFSQRRITKGLPVSNETFEEKIDIAIKHIRSFEDYNSCCDDIREVSLLEFGAGWDLIIPLSFYHLGIKQETIIDIRPYLKADLINNSIQRFGQFRHKLSHFNADCSTIKTNAANIPKELKYQFNIQYKAPLYIQNSNLPAESFDFISSTSVMEHVPKNEIPSILKECYRLLKKGGILSLLIDYKDHYSYFDSNISIYNFLQFSDMNWRKYNHNQEYQNRLRHVDYYNFINDTAFDMVRINTLQANTTDLETISMLHIDKKFSNKSPKELGIKLGHFVLHK